MDGGRKAIGAGGGARGARDAGGAGGGRAPGWLALLGVLALCACGGSDGAEQAAGGSDAQAEGEDALTARSAVDEAALRLDGEGAEDDDVEVEAALAAHGFGAPAVALLRAEALDALLLRTARAAPSADADALVARTLAAWHALAAEAAAARLQTLGALAGFDPRAAPVRVPAAAAEAAARAPEKGLDARGRRLVADARGRIAAAIGQHADLPESQARESLGSPGARAAADGAAAARALTGTPASSAGDAARAAARALRRSWQSLTDQGFDDQAWPALAALLGRPVPPPPAPARPEFALLDAAGLACAVLPGGLACGGHGGGALRIALDGSEESIALERGAPAASALERLLDRLPPGFAGCATSGGATYLRVDRAAPSLDGTPLEAASIGRSPAPIRPRPGGPPRELIVRGRFRSPGLRPAFLADFSGCELRVALIAQPLAGAPQEFEARIGLSSRLPDRAYEALLTDERGRTLAAARP